MFNAEDQDLVKLQMQNSEGKAQKWNIANIMSVYEEEIISQHQD